MFNRRQHRALVTWLAIAGTATLKLRAVRATRFIVLDAVELDVAGVTAGRRGKVPFTADGTHLRVELARDVKPGAAVTLAIEYSAQPRRTRPIRWRRRRSRRRG